MPISYAFYKRHGQGTFVCTCARAHRASVSQERLDRLCSNLVSGLWAMNYVLSTSHGWYISARAHVHTALLHLGNGLADCVQIWCLGWGLSTTCFPEVMGGCICTCARAHPCAQEVWCSPPPPLRFFTDSEKTTARRATGFWATL